MTDISEITGPEPPPTEVVDARIELANQFLHGHGLEIGALHLATVLPPDARARYVDRMSVADLRTHYPELATLDLAPVDVIDDGERLDTIEAESVNFIVANHFLEHCEDPIRTIQTHLSKLGPGGTLFYAVPDKRYTFDHARPRTRLEHIVTDHEHGPQRSRSEHYLAWVRAGLVPDFKPLTEQDIEAKAAELEADAYSIHFHVWTQADLAALMFHVHERQGNFEVEAIRRRGIENIVVLRKHGQAPVQFPVSPEAAAAAAPTPGFAPPPRLSDSRSPGIPLAGLRVTLDRGSERAHWSNDPDGIDGRAWVIYTEAPVTLPLTPAEPVHLHAHARLLPHDWRDGSGKVVVSIASLDDAARRRQIWSGTLDSADDPAGIPVRCEIPADTRRLVIGADSVGPRTVRTIARFALVEPYLTTPTPWPAAPGLAPEPPEAPDGPVISVLCPVHDPPPEMLTEAIESVLTQSCGNWELILSDDGSADPRIVAALDGWAASDPRIKLTRRPQAGGIATATNAALELATGEYVALLDHDDTLHPDALAHVTRAVVQDPGIDMLYSDEDIVLDGRPVWVHYKPSWSPDTLNTNGYTCHLGVYRRRLLREIGGFRSEFNGSQDVDMILRFTERTDRIGHIPTILYHWRIHPNSTAGGDAKPYAYVAARNAIAGHLQRTEIDADVEYGPPGLYRVVHHVPPQTAAAIVLAVDDSTGLLEAARSWLAQPHPAWSVSVAAPAQQLESTVATLSAAGLSESQFRVVAADPAEGRVAALQAAASAAGGAFLLIMESPLLGLSHDWLTRLIGYASQPGIAAAGPIVLCEDGRVEHAGIAVPDGLPLHLLHGMRPSMDDFFGYGTSVYNVRALSGALMTSRATFERLGGLALAAGSLAMIDYCMRAGSDRAGRIVTIGDARLRAVGVDTADNGLASLQAFAQRWSADRDPYYNRNYRVDRGDFTPRR